MSGRQSFILIFCAAAACTSDPPKPAPGPAASAAAGWVEWLALDENALPSIDKEPGWVEIFKRRYREAISLLGAKQPLSRENRIGLARAHLELARLDLALAHLLATARVRYFESRNLRKSLVPALQLGSHHRAVASLMLGQSGVVSEHALLGKSLAKPCSEAPAAKDAWSFVAGAVRCWAEGAPVPTCPTGQMTPLPAELDAAWKARIEQYYQALCGDADEASLIKLAVAPAEEEVTEQAKIGQTDVIGKVEHHDPLALWVLARHHTRRAQALLDPSRAEDVLLSALASSLFGVKPSALPNDTAEVPPSLVVFSGWRNTEEMKRALEGTLPADNAAPEAAFAATSSLTAQIRASLDAAANAPGRVEVRKHKLESAYGDALLRRAALAATKRGDCVAATRLFRATVDAKTSDKITARNEPTFFVQLATAALCRGETTEVIDTLRAVRDTYPEAEAVIVAVRALVSLEKMGGGRGVINE